MTQEFKLGKLPAKSNRKALLFEDFVKAVDVPASFNFWSKRTTFPIRPFGNDVFGDCTRASQAEAVMHMERIEVKQTPKISDDEVVRAYFDMTWRWYGDGHDGKPMPADWATANGPGDQGAFETDALSDWRRPEYSIKDTKGRPLTIDAFTKINQADQDAVRQAIFVTAGHGIKLCFNLPYAWAGKTLNWNAPPTSTPLTGQWMPGSWGGHSVYGYAYDEKGVVIKTWGETRIVSWEAFAIYCDEAHFVVDSIDAWRKKPAAQAIQFKKLADAVNDVSGYKIPS